MKKLLFSLALMLISLSVLSPALNAASPSADRLDLADYRGKVVVLDFWASWCVPCRRSFPWLNTMHARYAQQGLVIIGVNLDQQREEATGFLEKYPAKFQIHYDSDGSLAEKFNVRGMPSSYVIGRDGEVAAEHLGFKVKKQDDYEAAIVAALQRETVE